MSRSLSFGLAAALATALALGAPPAHAEERLTLAQAAQRARTSGIDVLLAETNVRAAEGDARAGRALPNPAVTFSVGRGFNYDPLDSSSSRWQYTVGLSDQALFMELLSGKHGLKGDVGAYAVAAAKADRKNAERLVVFATKAAYVDVVGAQKVLAVSKDIAELLGKVVELNRLRYPKVIDEGVLARVEAEKLEADQNVDQAEANLESAQAALAFVLGMRGQNARVTVDEKALDYVVPPSLATATLDALVQQAVSQRADAKQAELSAKRADASMTLAKRQRVPDVSLFLQYQQMGTGQNAVQPPTFAVGVGLPVPILDMRGGTVARAEADVDSSKLSSTRVQNQIVFDVRTAFAAFTSGQRIAARFENQLMERRRRAFEITKAQFEAGSATLMDFLDAERGFAGAANDRLAALVSYWKAVFALEAALGKEIDG
ncbi:MAG: TolC family protein [Polyangiaceae bacterium]|nr:TolC family protein [Polyangiaceae bacterium]